MTIFLVTLYALSFINYQEFPSKNSIAFVVGVRNVFLCVCKNTNTGQTCKWIMTKSNDQITPKEDTKSNFYMIKLK